MHRGRKCEMIKVGAGPFCVIKEDVLPAEKHTS